MNVFPSPLPGLRWNKLFGTQFSNLTQRSVSLREIRIQQAIYPLHSIALSYEVLRDDPASSSPASPNDELKKIAGFFRVQRGSALAFLWDNTWDDAVTDMQFAVANGTDTQFQLTRTYGAGGFAFAEPVQNVNLLTNIKDAGADITANCTVSNTGLVTVNTGAPTAGHALTWTGSFYYRVRFLEDAAEFDQFMYKLWTLKKLDFVGAPGNKV